MIWLKVPKMIGPALSGVSWLNDMFVLVPHTIIFFSLASSKIINKVYFFLYNFYFNVNKNDQISLVIIFWD